MRVVYQVRGRNPSSQDGLWVATIDESRHPLPNDRRAAGSGAGLAGGDRARGRRGRRRPRPTAARRPSSERRAATGDAARDGGAREGHDGAGDAARRRRDAAADAQAPPALPPAVIPTVPVRGRVLQKGTRRPLAGAVDHRRRRRRRGDRRAEGGFELRVAPGAHRVQIQTSGHDDADQTVEAGAGAADAEVLFRLAPRLTGERYETTVRTGRPEIPRVEVSGEEARAVAGTSGDPLRVIGSLPGVSQIVLAGGDLRRARREPRQHRLLSGRRARAGAVPPRARPVGDSPVPHQRRRFLSRRLPRQLRRLRVGDHGGAHDRAACGSRARVGRRHRLRRGRHHDRAVERRPRHGRRGGAVFVHGRAVLPAAGRRTRCATATTSCASIIRSPAARRPCSRSDRSTSSAG